MLTIGELATFMATSARRARHELKEETSHLLDGAVTEAKSLIGHELEEWAPLAPRTIAEKQRLGYTGQVSETDPLLRTGQLRDSIGRKVAEDFEGVVGEVGSDDRIAGYQEMGTSRIPPRPFLTPSMKSAEARAPEGFGQAAVSLLVPAVR